MLSTTTISILLLSGLSFITTFIGVVLAFTFKKNQKGILIGTGFSVGIMLLVSFLELLPVSFSLVGAKYTLLALLAGFVFVALLDVFFPHKDIDEKNVERKRLLKVAYIVAISLILHDFPEGFALANSYIHSPQLGLFIAIAIALHNIPEEFAMAVPLAIVGNKKKLLLWLAVISALAEPLGAIVGLVAVKIWPFLNPLLMSFAAGAMISVSLVDLIPIAWQYQKRFLFSYGIFLSILVYAILDLFI